MAALRKKLAEGDQEVVRLNRENEKVVEELAGLERKKKGRIFSFFVFFFKQVLFYSTKITRFSCASLIRSTWVILSC